MGFLLRRCSGKGPHLAMTGEPHGFSRVAAGFSSYDGELREPPLWPQGSPVSIRVVRGSPALLSSNGRGIGPQNLLKGQSRGLSRSAAGNPGFPRLVTVTSGSFSGCLWEIRNTVDLGGASQDSTGFGTMEVGLISSLRGNIRMLKAGGEKGLILSFASFAVLVRMVCRGTF